MSNFFTNYVPDEKKLIDALTYLYPGENPKNLMSITDNARIRAATHTWGEFDWDSLTHPRGLGDGHGGQTLQAGGLRAGQYQNVLRTIAGHVPASVAYMASMPAYIGETKDAMGDNLIKGMVQAPLHAIDYVMGNEEKKDQFASGHNADLGKATVSKTIHEVGNVVGVDNLEMFLDFMHYMYKLPWKYIAPAVGLGVAGHLTRKYTGLKVAPRDLIPPAVDAVASLYQVSAPVVYEIAKQIAESAGTQFDELTKNKGEYYKILAEAAHRVKEDTGAYINIAIDKVGGTRAALSELYAQAVGSKDKQTMEQYQQIYDQTPTQQRISKKDIEQVLIARRKTIAEAAGKIDAVTKEEIEKNTKLTLSQEHDAVRFNKWLRAIYTGEDPDQLLINNKPREGLRSYNFETQREWLSKLATDGYYDHEQFHPPEEYTDIDELTSKITDMDQYSLYLVEYFNEDPNQLMAFAEKEGRVTKSKATQIKREIEAMKLNQLQGLDRAMNMQKIRKTYLKRLQALRHGDE